MAAVALPLHDGPEAFLAAYEAATRARHIEHAEAYWDFALTSSTEAQARVQALEEELGDLHADGPSFEAVKGWAAQEHSDPLVAQRVDLAVAGDRGGARHPSSRHRRRAVQLQ
jgi:hypothetical protein